MNKIIYFPSALIVYLVVTGLLHSTACMRARREGADLVYGPTLPVRTILFIAVSGFTCGAIYAAMIHPPLLIGVTIFGFIAVATTFAFPSNILVSRNSVSEIKWWGTKTEIQWKDVSRIEFHKGPSTTVIRGRGGGKVVHSGWNRDTRGFLKACEERAGIRAEISEM